LKAEHTLFAKESSFNMVQIDEMVFLIKMIPQHLQDLKANDTKCLLHLLSA